MFSKKDGGETAHDPVRNQPTSATQRGSTASSTKGSPATIGPSIRINGDLAGEEDLVVDGRINGTLELKSNTLTIGRQGQVEARVYAHTILVEGTVNGDLHASERISIRQSARIEGNIYAPRISLEDGARFRGTIDMDTDSEAFRKAFGGSTSKAAAAPAATGADKAASPSSEGAKAANGASSSSKPAA